MVFVTVCEDIGTGISMDLMQKATDLKITIFYSLKIFTWYVCVQLIM